VPVPPVFVGDVQGCADELAELLALVERRAGSDAELWFVGDVVNRGPKSLRALELVRERVERGCARMVLGNHEIALLRTAFGQRSLAPGDTLQEILELPEADGWVAWLRRLPLAEWGEFAGFPFAMVHAAVDPSWDLPALRCHAEAAQRRLADPRRAEAERLLAADPRHDTALDILARLVSCRSVQADGSWSPEEPAGDAQPWHAAWRARGHDYGIVFGHWSLQGLLVQPGLRGLDTGCVHHGRGRDGFLTAWLPDESPDPFGTPDARFVQVRARHRYVFEKHAATRRPRHHGGARSQPPERD
jgi:bis(5'-nucleosyl)-tetraphosphatase (symmetrical)